MNNERYSQPFKVYSWVPCIWEVTNKTSYTWEQSNAVQHSIVFTFNGFSKRDQEKNRICYGCHMLWERKRAIDISIYGWADFIDDGWMGHAMPCHGLGWRILFSGVFKCCCDSDVHTHTWTHPKKKKKQCQPTNQPANPNCKFNWFVWISFGGGVGGGPKCIRHTV